MTPGAEFRTGGGGGGVSLPTATATGQVLAYETADSAYHAIAPVEFNVKSYGAVGDGTADDSPAFAAAWTAATTAALAGPGGYVIAVPAGKYKLQGVASLVLPTNLVGRIVFKGAGRDVTTIRLSSSTVALVSSGTFTVGDTLRNCTVQDLTIDANSVSGIGAAGIVFNVSVIASHVHSLNVRRVDVINAGNLASQRRCVSINVSRNDPFGVPLSTTLASNASVGAGTVTFTTAPAMAVGMRFTLGSGGSQQTLTVTTVNGTSIGVSPVLANGHTAGEAIALLAVASSTVTDIELEDCALGIGAGGASVGGGGATGVYIGAFCSPSQSATDTAYFGKTVTAAPVAFDQVLLRRVRWRSSADPTAFATSSGIQVGGDGLCEKIAIEQCYVRGSGDVGFELDGCMDLTVRECVSENAWNENFFVANNHGGLPNPSRQIQRFIDCTAITSVRNNVAAAFMASSLHGTAFGALVFQNCVFRHTSTGYRNGADSLEINPSNGGFYLAGKWRHALLANCKVIHDGLAVVSTANNVTQTPAGIVIQQMGGTGAVDVRDLQMEFNGSADMSTFTGCAIQADGVKIDFASRLTLMIDGVRWRTDIARLNAMPVRIRDVNFNLGANTMTDAWATAGTLASQYILDAGTLGDLSQGVGSLSSVANHTTRKSFRVWNMLAASGAPKNQAGTTMDGSLYTWAVTDASGPTGFDLVARLRVSDDGTSCVQAVLADDGANSTLRIEKVTAGTPTVIAGPTALTRMTAGQTVGVRLKQQGDSLTADYLSSPGSPPAYTTAGTLTTTYTLAAGTETQTWGKDGVPGYVGWGWTPGASGSTHLGVRYDRLHVISGTVDRLQPLGNRQGASATNGLTFNANSTNLRFDGTLECRGWNRGATRRDTPTDINGPDTTQKGQISVRDSTWASPPVPAAISLPASGVAYTNSDMVPEDIAVYGGTLTTPFLQVSRDGGTTKTQVAAATGVVIRLQPGDQLIPTYTVSTGITMQKSPVLA